MDGVFEVPSNNGVSKTGFRWQHPKEREPRHSECDIHTWKPPPVHSDTMQLFIIVPCPKCEHPFVVPAKPGNVGRSSAALIGQLPTVVAGAFCNQAGRLLELLRVVGGLGHRDGNAVPTERDPDTFSALFG